MGRVLHTGQADFFSGFKINGRIRIHVQLRKETVFSFEYEKQIEKL